MVQMINGYPCQNCTDISLAKRGLNPENPTNDPVKTEELALRKGFPSTSDADKDRVNGAEASTQQRSRAPGTGILVDFDA
ncbi:hypothetical protein E8L99_20665 [Phreatobacter aquaticus]|uniref:Uncharacterized protein n=1 Tax=Phreatobacter aquaticus TaxID=2570229 RepID=A0A4D7QVJ3_9HYPH|nr:hypothetical protein [Phreatobacter aquaticus]QCK87992.1 hypothetical protein E8L99_20665 [Phreatobacter aquaticus]